MQYWLTVDGHVPVGVAERYEDDHTSERKEEKTDIPQLQWVNSIQLLIIDVQLISNYLF